VIFEPAQVFLPGFYPIKSPTILLQMQKNE